MTSTTPRTAAISALRVTAFSAIAALLVEFVIGMNLYGQVPDADHGAGLFGAFGLAVVNGPFGLALHAIIGTLLLAGGIANLVRTIQTRRPGLIVISAIALLAILIAWAAGSSYVDTDESIAARLMGLATAVAILCYSIVLLGAPKTDRATAVQ